MHKNFLSTMALLAAYSLAACTTGEVNHQASAGGEPTRAPYFSVMSDSAGVRTLSLLLTMDQKGAVTVCITPKSGQTVSAELNQTLQSAINQAINDWNALLNQAAPAGATFPAWNQTAISVSFNCSSPDLTIQVDNYADRPYGDMTNHLIYYADKYWATPLFSCRHELGHILGLGDTYTEPGYQTPVGQPAGIMNGSTPDSLEFTEDDKAAIWNVWRFIKSGGDPCGPGYAHGAAGENKFQVTFCVLSGSQGDVANNPTTSNNNSSTQSGSCDWPCANYNMSEGQCQVYSNGSWQCVNSCMVQVSSCSGTNNSAGSSACYACSEYGVSEGQAKQFSNGLFQCQQGCLIYVNQGAATATDSSNCAYACADYGVTENGCINGNYDSFWYCQGGCLIQVSSCN